MFTVKFATKSVTTEVFDVRWSDLVEYCPDLADLSGVADAATYALTNRDEIARALESWARALSIWDKPEYCWAETIDSTNWGLGEELRGVLVQFVLC